MQITSVLAGFTLGQADILRRAMGKKKAKELDSMKQKFIDGAKQNHGIDEETSTQILRFCSTLQVTALTNHIRRLTRL